MPTALEAGMMELLADPQVWKVSVEMLNIRMRRARAKPVRLHQSYVQDAEKP